MKLVLYTIITVMAVIIMGYVKYHKNDFVGVTKGIYTFVKMKNTTIGYFRCIKCNEIKEAYFYEWLKKGREKCECMSKNTNHKLFHRYSKMLYRCYNEKSDNYPYYGGRGIKVCDRWKHSFDNFLKDMEPAYFKGAELDRIDNNLDYSPENCRWVTHSRNMLNRKSFKNSTGYHGVKKTPNNTYVGRVHINKKEYRTLTTKTPEEAYEQLKKLKQDLYLEMNIE